MGNSNSNPRRFREEGLSKESPPKPKPSPVVHLAYSITPSAPPAAEVFARSSERYEYHRPTTNETMVQRCNDYTSLYPDISKIQKQVASPSTASLRGQYAQSNNEVKARASVQSFSLNKPPEQVGTRPVQTQKFKKPIQRRQECPNASNGCKYMFDKIQIKNAHIKKCFFQDLKCPMNPHSGGCTWTGQLTQLVSHCENQHSEDNSAFVNKAMTLTNIITDFRRVYFVKMDSFNFLVHVFVSEERRSIFMNVQYLGFRLNPDNWLYEIHVYNKREPRRKFAFSDQIIPITKNVNDAFAESNCFVMPLSSAMTFINEGCLTYKFYIKKIFSNDTSSQKTSK